MGLQSKLFRGDPKLEASLVADSAHVTPGTQGAHVAKIQTALNQLSQAGLSVDGVYGLATANAVKAYKNNPARRILQPSQSTADDIVGKRTIESLDREMFLKEITPPFRIRALRPAAVPGGGSGPAPAINRSALIGFKIPGGFADLVPTGAPPPISQTVRLKPRQFANLQAVGTGGGGFLQCANQPPAKGDCREKIAWIWDPAELETDRLVPEPRGTLVRFTSETVGGALFLKNDPHDFRVDGFRPGDATIVGINSAGNFANFRIEVRASSAGPVPRAPLTKLEPGSKFFSASRANGGEEDPHGVFIGRPVNPRRGGRLINLGGEQETPEFEDYQVNLGFSGYLRTFTGNKFVFRPLFDDTDPTVRLGKSASHICIRGNPLTDEFIKAIKAIAQASCLFTFAGSPGDAQKAKQLGTVLEENATEGHIVIDLRV